MRLLESVSLWVEISTDIRLPTYEFPQILWKYDLNFRPYVMLLLLLVAEVY